MTAKIYIRKEIPVGVTLAKYLPQFQAEFAVLEEINANAPKSISTEIISQELIDDVRISITASTFNTVEDAIAASNASKDWSHDDVIAYNQANNVLTFNKIVNEDTGEVVQDWTQRW